MHKSYRAFTLNALRVGPLDVAESLSEGKRQVEKAKAALDQKMLKAVVVASSAAAATISALTMLVSGSVLTSVLVFFFFAAVIGCSFFIPAFRQKLVKGFKNSHEYRDFKHAQKEVEELQTKAREYQQRLEIKEGPGFLASYADVLVNHLYPSFFPLEERERFVNLSRSGRGADIDLFDYGKVVIELKANTFEDFIDVDALVEKVAPQNKSNAALAFARLIGKGAKADEYEVGFAALVGLNALLSFEKQGLPYTWTELQNKHWSLAKKVLKQAQDRNPLGLAKAIVEFEQVDIRLRKA